MIRAAPATPQAAAAAGAVSPPASPRAAATSSGPGWTSFVAVGAAAAGAAPPPASPRAAAAARRRQRRAAAAAGAAAAAQAEDWGEEENKKWWMSEQQFLLFCNRDAWQDSGTGRLAQEWWDKFNQLGREAPQFQMLYHNLHSAEKIQVQAIIERATGQELQERGAEEFEMRGFDQQPDGFDRVVYKFDEELEAVRTGRSAPFSPKERWRKEREVEYPASAEDALTESLWAASRERRIRSSMRSQGQGFKLVPASEPGQEGQSEATGFDGNPRPKDVPSWVGRHARNAGAGTLMFRIRPTTDKSAHLFTYGEVPSNKVVKVIGEHFGPPDFCRVYYDGPRVKDKRRQLVQEDGWVQKKYLELVPIPGDAAAGIGGGDSRSGSSGSSSGLPQEAVQEEVQDEKAGAAARARARSPPRQTGDPHRATSDDICAAHLRRAGAAAAAPAPAPAPPRQHRDHNRRPPQSAPLRGRLRYSRKGYEG